MELIERYLQAVKFWLPKAQKQDIIAELSEDIYSQMEEKESELGRKLSDLEVEIILKQRGRPVLVANRYQPQTVFDWAGAVSDLHLRFENDRDRLLAAMDVDLDGNHKIQPDLSRRTWRLTRIGGFFVGQRVEHVIFCDRYCDHRFCRTGTGAGQEQFHGEVGPA